MTFDSKEFEERLRTARVSLEDAIEFAESGSDEDFGPPGRLYVLGWLDAALQLLELTLTPAQCAAIASAELRELKS